VTDEEAQRFSDLEARVERAERLLSMIVIRFGEPTSSLVINAKDVTKWNILVNGPLPDTSHG